MSGLCPPRAGSRRTGKNQEALGVSVPARSAPSRLALVALLGAALAGCSAGEAKQTRGADCQAYLYSVCRRAVTDCKLTEWGASPEECVRAGELTCCGDQCDELAGDNEQAIAACQRAVQAASCELFAQPALPEACERVVR
ncbi:MAG: hypothetical protein OZ921_19035 [Sorangiineae bacterium]|nr:hypothetical protein [Polyangiaceae bacterium]MEB2324619.1 hypothetical protein [Sorangiineae bacterium]